MNNGYWNNTAVAAANLVGTNNNTDFNLPTSYNEFNLYTGEYPKNNIVSETHTNLFLTPYLNNSNRAPFVPPIRKTPANVSKEIDLIAKQQRYNKLYQNTPKFNHAHYRTAAQMNYNKIRTIKNRLKRFKKEVERNLSYLPNIRRNMTRPSTRKPSQLSKSIKNNNLRKTRKN